MVVNKQYHFAILKANLEVKISEMAGTQHTKRNYPRRPAEVVDCKDRP